MHFIGYIASLAIGISLGLIGGGGSILTVPVLVYLFRISPVMATAYSLFIVGSTSLVGALPKYKKGLVNLKTALIFGAPSIAAVFATRKYIVPMIPEELISLGGFLITKNILMMLLFAILMVTASVSMIRNKKDNIEEKKVEVQKFNVPVIMVEGIVVGMVTGLVGAGGGFLIIPALVLLSNLPMKQAIGTSLLIIAAKSLIGFIGDLSNYQMDWILLISVTFLAIIGIFIGNWLSHKVSSKKLEFVFGWFVLIMGIYIIIKEIFFQHI
ncbi:sulfite exporter TauE/SafE family protein [Chitinophagaceae bacterium LB-8]|uniref:Probable membrane transporter protein n=1 Tax=Paraflavisolibacter caeni TaxID=2982496 RepID=A0A9X2Y070_9BACT|nr:sulfite exporter TauE/SafE family protein [Paraflavisolibacter caeni]MCU7552160.1 sulfite exporter TauE/SafE family protein [Paraflavisolibacter caeni]